MTIPVDERREEFIGEIIAVCRKHRVLLEADWELFERFDNDELPAFKEHSQSQFSFTVNIGDVEHAVRDACWDEIHLPADGQR